MKTFVFVFFWLVGYTPSVPRVNIKPRLARTKSQSIHWCVYINCFDQIGAAKSFHRALPCTMRMNAESHAACTTSLNYIILTDESIQGAGAAWTWGFISFFRFENNKKKNKFKDPMMTAVDHVIIDFLPCIWSESFHLGKQFTNSSIMMKGHPPVMIMKGKAFCSFYFITGPQCASAGLKDLLYLFINHDEIRSFFIANK